MPALIVDPALQAAVIRQFNLRGELAPFQLTEQVVPIFDIGQLLGAAPTVVTTTVDSQGLRVGTASQSTALTVLRPAFDDGNVSSDVTVNPIAGAVLADTGAVAFGSVFQLSAQINWNTAIVDFQVEWRNAANDTTLAQWEYQVGTGLPHVTFGPVALNMLTSERIRIVTASGGTGTSSSTVTIGAVGASLAT